MSTVLPAAPVPDRAAQPSAAAAWRSRAVLGGWWLWPLAVLVLLPLFSVALAAARWDAESAAVVLHLLRTTLPDYAATSLWLCLLVGVGSACMGLGAAALVTLLDFPGRRQWEWLLLLPLAMPAYVSAYAYTDFLQFGGTAQSWLRGVLGVQGRVLPEIRNVWGAAFMFSVTLYPYVYLLARATLAERTGHLLEAARMLGAGWWRRLWQVVLPLARPAVGAGVALALMEVLADYGVSSYFGIQTFTVGIYKAWLVMDDRIAATQLAMTLLAVVGVLLWLEKRSRRRLRHSIGSARQTASAPLWLHGARGLLAQGLCALPVALGFALPVLMMLWPFMAGVESDQPVQWAQFAGWAANSIQLGLLAAALAVLLALLLAAAARRHTGWWPRLVVQLVGLGYAVPGAVIVIGLLLPVAALQHWQPESNWGGWVTTTLWGLVWAYLVRFTAAALHSVQSGYARIAPSQDAAARLLGASPWRLLTCIHLPLLRRPLLAALLLVFVDVMKELPATLVLRPFNYDTLAVVAYQLARDERLSEAAIPSLALVAAGLIPVLLLSRAMRQRQ